MTSPLVFWTFFALLTWVLAGPNPQDAPTPTVPEPAAVTHTVFVGAPTPGGVAARIFSPDLLTANVSDVILFEFVAGNHSASESTFAAPCVIPDGGFDSGFMPVAVNATVFPTFSITVQDTNPIFVHCQQVGHCGAGMVFAANTDESQESVTSFEIYQARAIALNGTEGPLATAAAPTPAVTHTVTVGAAGLLLFNPPFVSADPEDVVVFEFVAKNHSATQSTFDEPCVVLDGGFNSGFNPVAANATVFPTFNITVPSFDPIFVFCMQVGHCGQGMVFAVNPNETVGSVESYELFKEQAILINGTAAAPAPAPLPGL